MVTGAFASSLQGEPRSTHDIDLVVDMQSSHINFLVKEFTTPDYYLSNVAITDALHVFEVQFGTLDMEYLEKWVNELGVKPDWQRLLYEADTIEND